MDEANDDEISAGADKDSATATAEQYDVLGQLYDLTDPQPKYREVVERAPVSCPVEGIAVVAGRDAVELPYRTMVLRACRS